MAMNVNNKTFGEDLVPFIDQIGCSISLQKYFKNRHVALYTGACNALQVTSRGKDTEKT